MKNDNQFEDNFDIKNVLDEEGIGYKENGTHFFIDCPICGSKDNLNLDKKNKLWVCWSCVKTNQFSENKEGRGNLWTFLVAIGFDEIQVKQMFKGKKYHGYTDEFIFEQLTWDSYEQHDDTPTKEVLPYKIPKWLVYLDRSEEQIRRFPEVYRYLWGRGVKTKKQYQNFLIYYDFYRKRVVFPAITKDFICIGSQSRDITGRCKINHPKCLNHECDLRFHYYFKGEEEAPENCPNCGSQLQEVFYPKSLNSSNFPKTEFFFNEQNIDWEKPVVLVEGPFDSTNVNNSMAFLGKVLSETQFSILISKAPPEVILYMDGDMAGDYSAQEIYQQLRPFISIRIVYSANNDDPGAFSLEENDCKVFNAMKPSDWFEAKGLMYI